MEASESPHTRRALGAYYTPQDIAGILTAWTLRENAGPVLDPSYGTCRFLTEAIRVLSESGVTDPHRAVHGVDIDAEATAGTTNVLLARGARRDQFVHRNFFEVKPEPRFAAVLGNPPYVRHHWQRAAVKNSVANAMSAAGVELSRQASLWAPFVIHGDRFVRRGGRLAMLLPGAAIQASYAATVWEHLARHYARLTLIRIGERAFDDALEETVVVLADDRNGHGRRAPLTVEVASFDMLAYELDAGPSVEQLRKHGRRLERSRTDLTTRRLLSITAAHASSCQLGDIAEVRLGTVTGANAFFVRTDYDDLVRRLPARDIVPVVPGSQAMTGAAWTVEDDQASARDGRRCRLVRLHADRRPRGRLAEALAAAEQEGLHRRSHCRRRDPWWAIEPPDPPDAFLAYMSGTAKGIVVNRTFASCINGVHAIRWTVPDGDAYVLSTWTSLWALAVEQAARHYAGGVLKLEPGSAPNIGVVRYEDPAALDHLDVLLRSEGIHAARKHADGVVLRGALGLTAQQVRALQDSVAHLERRRSPRMRATAS